MLSVWLALDDSLEDNGALKVIPGNTAFCLVSSDTLLSLAVFIGLVLPWF